MEEELRKYLLGKVIELSTLGIIVSQEDIERVFNGVLNSSKTLEEAEQRIDNLFNSSKNNNQVRLENEKIKNGESSNFENVKKAISTIAQSELGSLITIYGGTVPYLLAGKPPKRVIGDVDLYANIDDMESIRSIINNYQDPSVFEIVVDSKDYSDIDYGLEMVVNGVPVSIFTHQKDLDNTGRIVRNFKENLITNSLDAQTIMFPGIFDENTSRKIDIDGYKIKVECPEYVFIQKSASNREKDQEDIEFMKENNLINYEFLQYLRDNSEMPIPIKEEYVSLSLDDKKGSKSI